MIVPAGVSGSKNYITQMKCWNHGMMSSKHEGTQDSNISLSHYDGFLALPQFFIRWTRRFRKGIDTEGRILESFECGDHGMLREALVDTKNEGLVRVFGLHAVFPQRWPL